MNALVVVAAVAFVCAIIFLLVFAAALLAAIMFHFVPKLQGTVLALTGSDVSQALRRMPMYPSWWHSREVKTQKPKFVSLALNHLGQTEYMYAFDPLHRPLFKPDRTAAMRLDSHDKFLIERLVLKAEDDALHVFVVPAAQVKCPETKNGHAGRLHTYFGLVPPRDIPQLRQPRLVARDLRPEVPLAVRTLQSPRAARKPSY
jgi:hypothetical protein